MTGRAETSQVASAHPAGRSSAGAESGDVVERVVRRNRRSFSGGDMLALRVGGALVILIFLWFAWEMTATVLADRAVGPGSLPPASMHGG